MTRKDNATPLASAAMRGALWSALETWGQRGVTTLTFLVVVRYVPKTDLGVMALATVYIMLAQTVAERGIGDAVIRAQSDDRSLLSSLFWRGLALSGLVAVLTLVLGPWVARLYGLPALGPVLQILAATPVLHALSVVPQAVTRRDLTFRLLALRRTLGAVAGGVAAMILAYRGAGVWALVAQSLIGQVLGLAVLWAGCSFRPILVWSAPGTAPISKFGLWVMAQALFRVVAGQIDRLTIGLFLGSELLGVYSVAQRVLLIISDLVAGSLERLILPLFAKVSDDLDRSKRGVIRANEMISLVVFPAYAGLVAVLPDLVPVLIGLGWNDAIPVVAALAGASLFFNLSFFIVPILTVQGKVAMVLVLIAMQGILNVVMVTSLSRYGLMILCIGLTLAQLLAYDLSIMALRRVLPIRIGEFLKPLWAPVILSLIMAGSVSGLAWVMRSEISFLPGWVRLAVCVIAGAAFYAALLRGLAPARFQAAWGILRGGRARVK